MLKAALQSVFGEQPQQEGFGPDWKDAAKNVKPEAPPALTKAAETKIEKFPLAINVPAKSAQRANARLIAAESELHKAETDYKNLRERHEAVIASLRARAEKALLEMRLAQCQLMREIRDAGALERLPQGITVTELLTAVEEEEELPPTVKLPDAGQ